MYYYKIDYKKYNLQKVEGYMDLRKLLFGLVAISCFMSINLWGDLKLRSNYSDNMVLQRDVPIKIYGYANAGETIKGELAGAKSETIVDKNGEFVLVFPAMKADGKPLALTLTDSQNQVLIFKNILIGEVYFASGQSNMEMPLWSDQPFWASYKGDEVVANTNCPQIRFIKVPRKVVHNAPQLNMAREVKWEVFSPETVASCSAVAYYFARKLHNELNVPVGIIQAAWGGTRIEPWISKGAFFKNHDKVGIDNFNFYDLNKEEKEKIYFEKVKAWALTFHNQYPEVSAVAANWKNVDIDDSDWKKISLPTIVTSQPDINWFRRTIEIPAEMTGKDLVLNLGEIDDCDDTYFNGVKVGSIDITHKEYWQTRRSYKIPANLVKKGKNVIAVRVYNYLGAGAFNGAPALFNLSTESATHKIDLSGEWLMKNEFVADMEKIDRRPQPLSDEQLVWNSTLYNGMVNPWVIYPIRGVIWYQGCSNAGEFVRYMTLFPMLINDWRDQWQDAKMPFLFVQLSTLRKHTPYRRESEDAWKEKTPLYALGDGFSSMREVQQATLRVPYTGMAVSIDRGDQYDIHPVHKKDIGERLADEAMKISFGKKGITASPYFKEMKIEGDKIRLIFDNADNGFTFKGDKINGFAIGDKSGNWQVADVVIENGNELVVSAKNMKNPIRVRYAFCAYPGDLNLYNREGYPVAPFRTDMPDYLLK